MGLPAAVLSDTLMRIPHCQQTDAWDCGLACISMVLQSLGHRSTTPLKLQKECPLESVWTIDLAYILRRYGVDDFTYYTSYIGVKWQYTNNDFYRDTLSSDRRRVHCRFAAAQENHIRVVPLILAMDDIRRFLISTLFAVIMLVDLRALHCERCAKRKRWATWCGGACANYTAVENDKHTLKGPAQWMSCQWESATPAASASTSMSTSLPLPTPAVSLSSRMAPKIPIRRGPSLPPSCSTGPLAWVTKMFSCFTTLCGRSSYTLLPKSDEFVGHYILLIAYDVENDLFYYRDPGTEQEVCRIRGSQLQAARMADGTDCDVIVMRVR
ncbi:Guanylylate cyclase-domain-containing protein [Gaertneriomyces semiglobifer]|nr:Guanylylate cyclase-domain-containing protein [Gaertneriomyces semiglobifer]